MYKRGVLHCCDAVFVYRHGVCARSAPLIFSVTRFFSEDTNMRFPEGSGWQMLVSCGCRYTHTNVAPFFFGILACVVPKDHVQRSSRTEKCNFRIRTSETLQTSRALECEFVRVENSHCTGLGMWLCGGGDYHGHVNYTIRKTTAVRDQKRKRAGFWFAV